MHHGLDHEKLLFNILKTMVKTWTVVQSPQIGPHIFVL